MRLSSACLVLALVGSSNAFTTQLGVVRLARPVFMSDEEAAESAPESPSATYTPSGVSIQQAKKSIAGLTKENFAADLAAIEPFLLNDAGASVYTKSMKRIAVQAKAFGLPVPEGYAKDAKATQKRRSKQDAFIQAKEAAREAAEAAAAEATAAAEDAAVAAASSAEEAAPEPVVA